MCRPKSSVTYETWGPGAFSKESAREVWATLYLVLVPLVRILPALRKLLNQRPGWCHERRVRERRGETGRHECARQRVSERAQLGLEPSTSQLVTTSLPLGAASHTLQKPAEAYLRLRKQRACRADPPSTTSHPSSSPSSSTTSGAARRLCGRTRSDSVCSAPARRRLLAQDQLFGRLWIPLSEKTDNRAKQWLESPARSRIAVRELRLPMMDQT